ncbi:MAG: hypothetical protein M1830_000935 [Pleopsidium flavum]|nr:MAG: hypothetical protein M1830_000935 [Pleopsidium flavum]
MATIGPPSTPTALTTRTDMVSPSPGTWRHPKFDEIARRQNATTFGDANVKKILWNSGSLLATWLLGNLISFYPELYNVMIALSIYPQHIVFVFRLLLVYNIAVALYPLIRRRDDLHDIPLTPSQRALLGLDPNATPPMTPGAQYITPPRYPRSSTPLSGTPGSRSSSHWSSPLSGRGNVSIGRTGGEQSFSPSGSPLLHKAIAGGPKDLTRRHSYGSPSPLGPNINGRGMSILGGPNTPSPTMGKGASVGLNSRWLYEKGRGSPGSRGLYS